MTAIPEPSTVLATHGLVVEFIARGAQAQGLKLEIRSTVPMGTGLSSSAALECATARACSRRGAQTSKTWSWRGSGKRPSTSSREHAAVCSIR